MSENFSPSINIVRDAEKKLRYIPTSNSKSIYKQISDNFKSGVHSFNIIGSYGTGKSAFLVAFLQHLSGEAEFFTPVNGQFNGCKKFKFYNIVGKADSLTSELANAFGVENDEKSVLDFIKKEHTKLKKSGSCLVLLIDEFGKFLEYAAKNNPEKELYFIQRLTEYANDSSRNILFLSTLHQNFDAYAVGLSDTQKKEWEKVKGRLKELTFNEPVEQLLQLAADSIKNKDVGKNKKHSPKLLKAIQATGVFNLLKNIDKSFAESLFPFDMLSSMVLTLSLQRYGQNERSLFNFLETQEHNGLNQFLQNKESGFYNLSHVFDYLEYNYYSQLTSKYNPDYFKWTMLRNSLERVEMELSDKVVEAQKLIKTIGLLDIFSSSASKINGNLLSAYAESALDVKNAEAIITVLEDKKIIRYQSFKEKYKLFEGTDVDIEKIQRKARKEISNLSAIVPELKKYFQLSYVPAKAATYQKGTPRLFEYTISEEPILEFSAARKEVDGLVNLVFPEVFEKNDFKCKKEPVLHGVFTNTQNITEQIQEIRSLEKALTLVTEDIVATTEIKELQRHLIRNLNALLNEELFNENSEVTWMFEGKEVAIKSKRQFNSFLSKIIEKVYPNTPVFRNELMNKTKVSSSIHFAKRQYIEALLEFYNRPGLGFPDDKNPAEKTIYTTLLKETGIHSDINGKGLVAEFLNPKSNSSFEPLWKVSIEFLESAKTSKRSVKEFIEILSQKPLRLKEGFIEFWIISFLFIQREEFALFREGQYVPRFSKEILELIFKDAKKFDVKTFDIKGVKLDLFNKYRELTQQDGEEIVTSSSFQDTARPFLVFFKNLPKYAQATTNLSHDTIAFRKAIKGAKELEKTFFEDLPSCFGLSVSQLSKSKDDLEAFAGRIRTSIDELRSAENNLIERVEGKILDLIGSKAATFSKYQSAIQKRYSGIKEHLLNSRQKTFYTRINSKIPEKTPWINSLVHALIGKQLNTISDSEELVIYDRFKDAFKELDNLLELSKVDLDETTEEAFRIEITGTNSQILKKNVILSKQQKKALKATEEKVRKVMEGAKDDEARQAILIKLLKELLQ